MYNDNMRCVIEKSMDYAVKNIHTYKGYAGADILKLTFHDNQELLLVRDHCKSRGIQTAVKLHKELELYCIYETEKNDEIYPLKP
ncbi:hypothetical protein [Candidatus Sulfurimonas baltica]|uniref:Uncharacterized protein n=1 Tax=Candidatus Sulfurimonas baltica TaxID=2740404 RepID=A0A7S7RNZ2_9BACT|nr:hypothetical protein [Candidatus Sulfurimonas baltica]QOY53051.1 hypothetical protein HUE88_05065 [Candidatus Sulfurimonas baltica]